MTIWIRYTFQRTTMHINVDDGAFVLDARKQLERGLHGSFWTWDVCWTISRWKDWSIQDRLHFIWFPYCRTRQDNRQKWRSLDQQRRKQEHEKEKVSREANCFMMNWRKFRKIDVADCFMTSAKQLKYLGSYKFRITAANQAMCALQNSWDNPLVDTCSKFIIFRVVPIILLLWGCKAWFLQGTPVNKLEVFLHRHARRILKISILQAKDDRITREDIREKF